LAIPIGIRIFTFLTAGFCEELLFRAYAIERLTMLTGNLWAGSIAAVVLFTLGHIPRYGFGPELLGVLFIAVALTALYAWRRNFWVCATMHAAIDAFGLVVAPALSAHAR
jgi:membrane protease YdiL (CAAX protease family)